MRTQGEKEKMVPYQSLRVKRAVTRVAELEQLPVDGR